MILGTPGRPLGPRKSAMYDLKQEKMLLTFKEVDHSIFKFTILAALFFGALGPVFRDDVVSKYVSAVCVLVLAVLAGITLFKRRES
jgi:hypothetical protein